jgi:hypothetical protein
MSFLRSGRRQPWPLPTFPFVPPERENTHSWEHNQPENNGKMTEDTSQLSNSKPLTLKVSSRPRRALTDHDRRRMCQYHVDNPFVKQAEIGGKNPEMLNGERNLLTSSLAMFGIERSYEYMPMSISIAVTKFGV